MARSLESENVLTITVYSAFVRPILAYGSTLFIGAKPMHLEKLDRVDQLNLSSTSQAHDIFALRHSASGTQPLRHRCPAVTCV